MNKEITHVDHFSGNREQTDFYHISDKATKPNAKYGSDRWTLYTNGKEQEVHMGDWLIRDTLGATYIITDEEMRASLNHTTGKQCPYCRFEDGYTWSTDKNLIDENYKNGDIHFITAGLIHQYGGIELTIGVGAMDMAYQFGVPINYCPMCGRYLGGNNDKD